MQEEKSGCTRATTRCATALRSARVITNCDESADLIDAGNDRVVASCVAPMRINRGMEWKEWKKRKMPHNFSVLNNFSIVVSVLGRYSKACFFFFLSFFCRKDVF